MSSLPTPPLGSFDLNHSPPPGTSSGRIHQSAHCRRQPCLRRQLPSKAPIPSGGQATPSLSSRVIHGARTTQHASHSPCGSSHSVDAMPVMLLKGRIRLGVQRVSARDPVLVGLCVMARLRPTSHCCRERDEWDASFPGRRQATGEVH